MTRKVHKNTDSVKHNSCVLTVVGAAGFIWFGGLKKQYFKPNGVPTFDVGPVMLVVKRGLRFSMIISRRTGCWGRIQQQIYDFLLLVLKETWSTLLPKVYPLRD